MHPRQAFYTATVDHARCDAKWHKLTLCDTKWHEVKKSAVSHYLNDLLQNCGTTCNFTLTKLLRETLRSAVMTRCRWSFAELRWAADASLRHACCISFHVSNFLTYQLPQQLGFAAFDLRITAYLLPVASLRHACCISFHVSNLLT